MVVSLRVVASASSRPAPPARPTRNGGSQPSPLLHHKAWRNPLNGAPLHAALVGATAAAALLLAGPVQAALPEPNLSDPQRCLVSALDKFADTRAKFSLEASGGNMVEAIVDIRLCDTFAGKQLQNKVLSGVFAQGANFEGSDVSGAEIARAAFGGANLRGVNFSDANIYSSTFEGADLEGANFENSILTGASFGKDASGKWANLKGAHFEGALLGSSDVQRICENPTLDKSTKKAELGCK